jgi:hypothetical protein
VSSNEIDDPVVLYALVCLKTGMILESFDQASRNPALQDFAAALPEIFGAAGSANFGAMFARVGSEGSETFREVVLVSSGHVRVMERVVDQPGVALVAVAPRTQPLGLVLAGLRHKLLQLPKAG